MVTSTREVEWCWLELLAKVKVGLYYTSAR